MMKEHTPDERRMIGKDNELQTTHRRRHSPQSSVILYYNLIPQATIGVYKLQPQQELQQRSGSSKP
ncbi:hypothetical protein Hanom_Chr04g00302661 [Helianthus anomalus]